MFRITGSFGQLISLHYCQAAVSKCSVDFNCFFTTATLTGLEPKSITTSKGRRRWCTGLGNKGMELLERHDGVSRRKLDWSARNRSVTRYFMEHTLAVADVMVALELCCRRQGVDLIPFTLPSGAPLRWNVPVHHGGAKALVGVIPDRVFGLKTKADTHWVFLEADRATMPVERSNLKQTSFCRKLMAYHETWRQTILKDSFPRFQVLTVTTTAERVRNLVKATRRLTQSKGSGLFLFADHKAFTSVKDALQLPLLNGRGEEVTLLD